MPAGGADPKAGGADPFVEEVELQGHIIDSLLLPKVLDEILTHGGTLRDQGHPDRPAAGRPQLRPHRGPGRDRRAARRKSSPPSTSTAPCPREPQDCQRRRRRHGRRLPRGLLQHHQLHAPRSGSAASGSTSRTRRWTAASSSIPRSGGPLRADDRGAHGRPDRRRPAGPAGLSRGRAAARHSLFEFMASPVSSEKPKGVTVREIAAAMRRTRAAGEKILAVLGPGRRPHRRRASTSAELIRDGLPQRPLRRQRPGDARHRAGALRHQPGRLAGARPAGRGGARAPPAGDQHHPPAGRHRAPPSRRACSRAASCTSASSTTSRSCWPAASATTARCRK